MFRPNSFANALLLSLLVTALISSNATAQTIPAEMADIKCMIGKKISCRIPCLKGAMIFSCQHKPEYDHEEEFPTFQYCQTGSIVIPESCKRQVYLAADVNRLLHEQAIQFRDSQVKMCRRIASKPELCDSPFPKPDQ